MSATPITPAQTDALAKLAEIPAVGSHDRLCWLLEAERCGFERTSGGEEIPEYDPPAYFGTRDELLTLMSEARKQGQRDVLGAGAPHSPVDQRVIEKVIRDTDYNAAPPNGLSPAAWLAHRIAAALATGGARHG